MGLILVLGGRWYMKKSNHGIFGTELLEMGWEWGMWAE